MSKILATLRVEALRSSRELPKTITVPYRTKYYHNRHRDPKYRLERTRKVWKIDLPDFDKMRAESKVSPDQMRSQLKEKGVVPPTPWDEREIYNPSTIGVIDPEKTTAALETATSLKDKFKSTALKGAEYVKTYRNLSEIKAYEGEDFSLKDFDKQCTEIYIKAHQALAEKDENKMLEYVTEHCFPLMTAGINRQTIHWKYLGDVEPPKTVLVRATDMLSKGNKYAQITVKMHTKQMLAIYDRHGRLAHGSPVDVKEVLEYVVFEKYLANEYSNWRIHDRIRPDEPTVFSQIVSRTYVAKKAA